MHKNYTPTLKNKCAKYENVAPSKCDSKIALKNRYELYWEYTIENTR